VIDEAGLRWAAAMRRGAFDAAHAISDVVLANRNPSGRDDPRLPYHLRWVWDGRDLAGRNVLVRCYHGLGDTIQFARFLPVLRQRAASVTVEVQPELFRLLAMMQGPDRLIPFRPDEPTRPAERDVEIMELAHALRLDPGAVPVPYLRAPPAPIGSRDGLNVGLCWRAGDWDRGRSVPAGALRAACDQPRVHVCSLQYREGDADAEASDMDCRVQPSNDESRADAGQRETALIPSLIDENSFKPSHCEPPLDGVAIQGRRTDVGAALDCFVAGAPRSDEFCRQESAFPRLGINRAIPPGGDVMATASAIVGLDLVVTVDTMVAHLAGALGKPTWLLLRHECDWRWMERRADSPWYPSMRLYRQDVEGDWHAPLERLAADLRLRATAAGC